MSLFGFSDKGARTKLPTLIVMFVLSFVMVAISAFYLVPNDMFTSALFFEGMGLQKVFISPATKIGPWGEMPDFSTEAFIFAVMLSLSQIFMGYRAATSKGTGLFKSLILTSKGQKIEWERAKWTIGYILVAVFDTWTDAEYRSFFGGQGIGLYIKAIFFSFAYYNLFSEWAVVGVGSYMIKLGMDIVETLKQNKKQGRPNNNNNNSRNQNRNNRGNNQKKNNNPQKQINRAPQPTGGNLPTPPSIPPNILDLLDEPR